MANFRCPLDLAAEPHGRHPFRALWAHDMAVRASSFKAMVTGGMDPAKAAALMSEG